MQSPGGILHVRLQPLQRGVEGVDLLRQAALLGGGHNGIALLLNLLRGAEQEGQGVGVRLPQVRRILFVLKILQLVTKHITINAMVLRMH